MWENYVADDQDSEPGSKVSNSSRGLSRLTVVRRTEVTHPLWDAGRHSWKIPPRSKRPKIDRTCIRGMLLGSMKKRTHPWVWAQLHFKDGIKILERYGPFWSREVCVSKAGVIAKGRHLPCFPEEWGSTPLSSSSKDILFFDTTRHNPRYRTCK